ncbi:hypothetical protein QJS04_geneDACA011471 [Acorus gramineus]|uniref:RING-type domain-containing protein n=1 Tax=Acorus gramineus TaxID=55184 RepID=A0AAV9AKS3_ACOGR|nr:hypothetical protein QJS04_geneDACA011471 [Acorus gramineus]
MRRKFKESLKELEAHIQYANTVAEAHWRECDGVCLQMRMSYSQAAQFFLFLVQWTNCRLAGALGLMRILIYKTFLDGKSTMYIHERKASIKDFYSVIYPSLLQLESGISDVEYQKQRDLNAQKYKKKDEIEKGKLCEIDAEREEECGICMETNSKVVLPDCNHSLCMKCYRDWHARSQSCPFCRDSLKRVNSNDLWMYMDNREVVDMNVITKENIKRLFVYIDKLPLLIPDPVFLSYDSHFG